MKGSVCTTNGKETNQQYPTRTAFSAALWVLFIISISNGANVLAQSQDAPISAAPAAAEASRQAPAAQAPGSINGTVVDQDGAVIANVKIILELANGSSTGGSSTRETLTDTNGHFVFTDVAPGYFQLSLTASGFALLQKSGILNAGENLLVPQVALAVARNTVDVEVTVSQEQVAEEQVKVEEQQRLLGVFPNFYVSYVPNAAPLTSKLKFQLAWKSTFDPVSFVVTGAVAGLEQAEDAFSGYGQGAQGYAKRYGAAYANQLAGTFIGGAILPSLLKQDPRYFVKGTGTTKQRFFYAVANSVICKGDNGHWQPNYSYILGDLAAGGISNLYYPAQNRNGAALTFENALIGIGGGALGNVLQEFFLRRFTHHAPPQSSTSP
ncbi:MAG TPA: carboxypeptidase-like regulatory domain-containing protein [Candidatus Acidoferrum sp.]|nr:carboxypeptidase-like regulatory domain-containing protein [Candidatus Acidoferrum sp.]